MDLTSFMNKTVLDAPVYDMSHFTKAEKKGEKLNRSMANEMQYPPVPSIQQAVVEAAKIGNLYTSPYLLSCMENLAKFCGVEVENITLGNGSTESMEYIFRLFLEPGDELVGPTPDYPAYRTRTYLLSAKYVGVPLNRDLSISADGLLEAVNERTKLIVLSRPHNPSGTMLPIPEIERLLEREIPVLVDEAYIELSDHEKTVIPLIKAHPNLMVIRTFSKGFGLAGLRLGYTVADPTLISYINRIKLTANLNILAVAAANAALSNLQESLRYAQVVCQTREWMFNEISSIKGLKPYPSQANFILVSARESGIPSDQIVAKLFDRDIYVRDFSKSPGLPPREFFRITVGTRENMEKILDELKNIVDGSKPAQVKHKGETR